MIELSSFLLNNPSMRLQPVSRTGETVITGQIHFHRRYRDICIADSYRISISIPNNCPHVSPNTKEIGGKIPRKDEFHINPDETLCLGSPLRIMLQLNKSMSLNSYYEHFLLPYLFAVSAKLQGASNGMIFGELAHGKNGVIDDYVQLFKITASSSQQRLAQVERVLWLLSKGRIKARRKTCFCGCGKRLMHCRAYRNIRWFWQALPAIAWRNYFKEFKRYG